MDMRSLFPPLGEALIDNVKALRADVIQIATLSRYAVHRGLCTTQEWCLSASVRRLILIALRRLVLDFFQGQQAIHSQSSHLLRLLLVSPLRC